MDEQAILGSVRRWIRFRNGVRAAGGAAIAVLGAAIVARLWGASVPGGAWMVVPAASAVGIGWPVSWERAFLGAGRRLGIGERLAALDVAVRHGSAVFLEALVEEISIQRPRAVRLVAGRAECALGACALGLALAVGFVAPPSRPHDVPADALIDRALEGLAADPEPAGASGDPLSTEVVPPYPSEAAMPRYSPYQDLLASVLGLDEDQLGGLFGEELAVRLAAEEGLLRQLAERLAAAVPGGISPSERDELAPLARELARRDLRQRVEDLLDQGGDAAAREAVEAVQAVLDAAERAGGAGEVDPGAPAVAGPATGTGAEGDWDGDGPYADLFDANGFEGAEPPAEGGIALNVPGATEGDPVAPGPAGGWDPSGAEQEEFGVEGEQGPMRAYLVRGVPGEPAGEAVDAPPSLASQQEVELVLQARGIPAELRDLVRRYFELIGGVP